jgi:hypothetical protein
LAAAPSQTHTAAGSSSVLRSTASSDAKKKAPRATGVQQ